MTARPILIYPDERLTRPTHFWDFDRFDVQILATASQDMVDTLRTCEGGLALAANQIGVVYSIVCLSPQADRPDDLPDILVNPVWIPNGERMATGREGCLSFPGISLRVNRHECVYVTFQMLDGEIRTTSVSGLWARVIAHECDHLWGKTFLQYQRLMLQKEIVADMILRQKATV